MKYNFKIQPDIQRAREALDKLIESESLAELKKVSPKRSLSQNSYLHLLLQGFGAHFGYNLAEAKLIYKELNSDIYAYKKKDRTFYRSSAELTKEEMTKSIEKLRDESARAGYPLPSAVDQEWLRELENSIELQARYL